MMGKEVINIADGARLGVIEECDLGFEARTGKIEALLLPGRGGLLQLFSEGKGIARPWQAIRRIGDEVIIADMNDSDDWDSTGKRHPRRND